MGKREQNLRYYQKHKAKLKADAKKWRELHPNYFKDWRKGHLDYMDSWRKATKIEVLTYYGNNKLACVRCGFSDERALSIDHINDNGAQHRRKIAISGDSFYRWLKRKGFPEGYQTLCMNCQFIKKARKTALRPGR